MGKRGIFEYVNLNKKTETSRRTGQPYDIYVVVSDKEGQEGKVEINSIRPQLYHLGFQKNIKQEMFQWANKLTQEQINGVAKINQELKDGTAQDGNLEAIQSILEDLKEDIAASTIPLQTQSELQLKLNAVLADIVNTSNEQQAGAFVNRILNFSNDVSRFHPYTFDNIILIYAQDPNATKVASRNRWRKKFNREVIDIQKAITINCGNKWYIDPSTGREEEYKIDQQNKDRAYEKQVQGGDIRAISSMDTAITARRRKSKPDTFASCPVFDIANTTGDDVPDEELSNLTSDTTAADITANTLFGIAKKSLEAEGIAVTQDPATASEIGWSRGNQINISSDVTGANAAYVIFGEWAHDLLHKQGGKFHDRTAEYFAAKGDLNPAEIQQIKLIQAKTVAATVCGYYKLPIIEHPNYKQLMQAQGGLDSKQIVLENVNSIVDVSNHIVKTVEANREAFGGEDSGQPQYSQQQPQAEPQ